MIIITSIIIKGTKQAFLRAGWTKFFYQTKCSSSRRLTGSLSSPSPASCSWWCSLLSSTPTCPEQCPASSIRLTGSQTERFHWSRHPASLLLLVGQLLLLRVSSSCRKRRRRRRRRVSSSWIPSSSSSSLWPESPPLWSLLPPFVDSSRVEFSVTSPSRLVAAHLGFGDKVSPPENLKENRKYLIF